MQLHRRPTFQEVAGLINNPDFKIHYPNRFHSNLARTPEMSQFYGNMEGILELQEQSNNILKQQLFDLNMKKVAAGTRTPYNHLVAQSRTSTPPVHDVYMSDDEFLDDMTEEEQKRALEERARQEAIRKEGRKSLTETALQYLQHIPTYLRPARRTDNGSVYDFGSAVSDASSLPPLEDLETVKAYENLERMANAYGGKENKSNIKLLADGIKHAANLKQFDKIVEQNEKDKEQVQKKPKPFGLRGEDVSIPKRARSTTRKGTKREGDDPEGTPRRVRSSSINDTRIKQTISKLGMDAIPEKRGRGRPKLNK